MVGAGIWYEATVQVGYSTKIQDVRRSGQIPGLKDSCSRVREA